MPGLRVPHPDDAGAHGKWCQPLVHHISDPIQGAQGGDPVGRDDAEGPGAGFGGCAELSCWSHRTRHLIGHQAHIDREVTDERGE